ncbi:MAG TPA: hypothetical protein VIM16_22710 [Mucilaginibacter sp.]|jgi:hypothetical protein
MKKLHYNIYSNITDRQFLKIEKKLLVLKYKMSKYLLQFGWQQLPEGDGLAIAFAKKNGVMRGSIGLVFDDHPNGITFTFDVMKCFDENNDRFCLENNLFEQKELSFFENKIEEFTQLAFEKCNSWERDDIIALGEKIELG